jgi:hypothetical protein
MRSRRIIEAGIIVSILSIVLYLAWPAGPSKTERAKVEQMIQPLKYEDAEVLQVLQDIINKAGESVTIDLCRDLASRRITLQTDDQRKLKEILALVSAQLKCDLVLYIGIEGTLARPRFLCPSGGTDMISIEKQT